MINRKWMTYIAIVAGFLAIVLILASCSSDSTGPSNARETNERAIANQEDRYNQSQPVPAFDWSQLRETAINIITAQAQTTDTTTFFFNQGVLEPVSQCPSIGYPLPTTTQLTNPSDVVSVDTPGEGGSAVTVGQMEPSGVFSGDSTGTYALCVNGNGDAYAQYWEGFIMTVSGQASFEDGNVILIGEPSFDFSEGEG